MINDPTSQTKKRRGRRTNAQKDAATSARQQNPPALTEGLPDEQLNQTQAAAFPTAESPEVGARGKQLSPISDFLHSILAHDRAGITRLARLLDVTEHTVYRWMNGTSLPQQAHLKRLPNVLPEHRNKLIDII